MQIVKATLKANPNNSVIGFKDNSSAIRCACRRQATPPAGVCYASGGSISAAGAAVQACVCILSALGPAAGVVVLDLAFCPRAKQVWGQDVSQRGWCQCAGGRRWSRCSH